MNIETWISDKGHSELQHFLDDSASIYLFGFNKQLLGDVCYNRVKHLVEERLNKLNESKLQRGKVTIKSDFKHPLPWGARVWMEIL